MNIIVRNEEPKDHRRTEEVAREAFWNLYFPGAAEHYVVHKMRSHPDFIQELAFVIEVDGTVEGAIFYTAWDQFLFLPNITVRDWVES